MTKQLLFATMWGVLDSAGGRYPLAKLPQVRAARERGARPRPPPTPHAAPVPIRTRPQVVD